MLRKLLPIFVKFSDLPFYTGMKVISIGTNSEPVIDVDHNVLWRGIDIADRQYSVTCAVCRQFSQLPNTDGRVRIVQLLVYCVNRYTFVRCYTTANTISAILLYLIARYLTVCYSFFFSYFLFLVACARLD